MRGIWPVLIVLGLVTAALLFGLSQFSLDLSDARVQQGAVAAALVVLGWFVTFALTEWREVRTRDQKSRDIQAAFKAELVDYSAALDDGDFDAVIEDLKRRAEAEAGTIFFPLVSDPVIFNSLTSEVALLPEGLIDDVIQFYSLLSDVQLFAKELRGQPFSTISREGKVSAYIDYLGMRAGAALIALEASVAISKSLFQQNATEDELELRRQWSARAEEIRAWINRQDEGHDGPQAS